jgi:hypothetical protein
MLLMMTGFGGLLCLNLRADEAPKPAEAGTLIVIDSAGKEQKLKSWKFVGGVKALPWLAPEKVPGKEAEKEPAKEKAPAKEKVESRDRKKAPRRAPAEEEDATPKGPLALAVRDETKIHFAEGVLTLVPLSRIRTIEFDNEAETMTVRVAVTDKPDADVTLTGTTAYKGINKVTLEADVDKGEAGVASLTYHGGVPKGIKGIRFGAPQVEAAPKPGRPAVVQTADKDVKRDHKVADLQALYRLGAAQERLLPTLMFKKTLKLNLNNVKKIAAAGEDPDETAWQVVQKDGDDSTFTLLPFTTIDEKRATLAGLVGKVPAGYKLFPIRRIAEVNFDTTEGEKEKEKEKEKPKDEKEKE